MSQAADLNALKVAKKTAERAYFSAKYAAGQSAETPRAPKVKREPTPEQLERHKAFGAASSERAKIAKPIREEIKAANPTMPAKEVAKLVNERIRAAKVAIVDAPAVEAPAAEVVADTLPVA